MSMPAPDFVMVGGQHDGKVYLLASTSLTELELRDEAEQLDDPYWRYRLLPPPPRFRHFINAEVRDYVQVIADDYPTAFATLFAQWAPTTNRPAIAAQTAIEATR